MFAFLPRRKILKRALENSLSCLIGQNWVTGAFLNQSDTLGQNFHDSLRQMVVYPLILPMMSEQNQSSLRKEEEAMALKQTIYLPDGPKPLWCSCCSSSMTSLFQKRDLFHLEHISPRSSYSFSSFRSMFKLPLLRDTPGEGNGNPLQYSYLENPMNRGAWQAQSMGSQKGHTRLSK